MRLPGGLHLSGRLERFQPILTDRLQHHRAGLLALLPRGLQQTLVGERGHALQRSYSSIALQRGTDRLYRLQGAATNEDGKSPEQPLFLGREEIVAPGKCAAQRLLPGGSITWAARQDRQSLT